MGAEVGGRSLQNSFPSGDALAQGPVYIFESFRGGWVPGLAEPVKQTSGQGLLVGLITQERVLERDLRIGRIQVQSLSEFVPTRFGLPDLEQRICQILMDRSTIRR